MTPPLRLPIFIMGIAAGLIRVQRQQAAMKDQQSVRVGSFLAFRFGETPEACDFRGRGGIDI